MTGELWGLMGNWYIAVTVALFATWGNPSFHTSTQKVQRSLYSWALHVLKGEYHWECRSEFWSLTPPLDPNRAAFTAGFGSPDPQMPACLCWCLEFHRRHLSTRPHASGEKKHEDTQTRARVSKLDLHVPLSRNTFFDSTNQFRRREMIDQWPYAWGRCATSSGVA